jgi:hypothetical protein
LLKKLHAMSNKKRPGRFFCRAFPVLNGYSAFGASPEFGPTMEMT